MIGEAREGSTLRVAFPNAGARKLRQVLSKADSAELKAKHDIISLPQ